MLNEQKRQSILEVLETQISKKRYEHVLRVEKKAIELATAYNVDVEKCQYAALLHDYAKEWSMEQYQVILNKYALDMTMLDYGSEILHGPVAAMIANEQFHIKDKDILDAIFYHTIGHDVMSDVAKVLFVADYIEDGRTFHGVVEARVLARQSLDSAIVYKLQQTIMFLAQKKVPIFPDTIKAYNTWISKF
ncbi:bis(5'-nucleosyl)-tetraphosphatase (symmetrical) YqeK [Carnobacteriaceae bacterium zg-ZUI78]|uniref:bis(5'-nucleosyl)-tetraphosphatase (symmetrical) YqeK n=1 Tax=Granulicatella sp. zg-84 TaxID=2678503 RepID=UPI0013C19D72|nr:bis(5'-nucleosyl)-tetraphosphatase (symmetrical) YqeK [Granulicatella sp. zg-84]MBS4750785.1 bis(5'-nucleosyl)-tetraphosphatase (symmetrical) YqeK [Carnobacteriaceae bacterium zg-ZUI78]NEW66503.1 HD domain-containing protein [Granulicatella sp. zg-84]QMI85509.1 bis(5'-nucleosyl)-tetraphosphatase (symmetrical) YqeK [Carnobacteriaceae bacterium zg-84]